MRAAALAGAILALAACDSGPSEPAPIETEIPQELQQDGDAAVRAAPDVSGATPMDERVATLGLLNKRNNVSQDLEMRPGESRRIGDIIVRLSACERTAPWEMPQETGAFVQVLVEGNGEDSSGWSTIFSGWLFQRSPSLNVVEHPVYDVWVKDCTMRFPGEPAPEAPASSDSES